MMDATGMYHPDGFHPCFPGVNANYTALATSPYTRTERPPKYYLIDFGLSRQFGEGETPLASDLTPGTDDTAPEYDDDAKPLNAYFIDVYCAGNMIRKEFIDVRFVARTTRFPISRMVLTDSTGRLHNWEPRLPPL